MKRTSFILHLDSLQILDEMNTDQIATLFIAMRAYHTGESMPDLDFGMKMAFAPFAKQFERDNEKFAKTCERNRNNITKRWTPLDTKNTTGKSGIPLDTKNTENENESERDSENTNVIHVDVNARACETRSQRHLVEKAVNPSIATIVDDLNAVCSTSYKHTTPKTVELISARMKEGFTEQDFFTVHKNMFALWSADSKMREFLRPITLYSNKFESYLNKVNGGELDKHSEAGKHAIIVGMNWLKNRQAQREAQNA